MIAIVQLDQIVQESLCALAQDIADPEWYGREREIVSRYMFDHFLPRWQAAGFHAAHLGIEVAVPQVLSNSRYPHTDVCKDIVIWPTPAMTCWAPNGQVTHYPLAVLEWKVVNKQEQRQTIERKRNEHQNDILWLQKMANVTTAKAAKFVGYGIWINQRQTPTELYCARVQSDQTEQNWLNLPLIEIDKVPIA